MADRNEAKMKNWYLYEQMQEGTVRLLRVFGTSPEVTVPNKINGMPVKEIGAYCFSSTSRISSYEAYSCTQVNDNTVGNLKVDGGVKETGDLVQLCQEGKVRELCGKYIQKIVLPKNVVSLGNFACYQCSCLEEIVVGNKLTEIGSDAFMNCRNLKNITVLGSVEDPSGLKQILGQRNLETTVTFQVQDQIETVLLYPEYNESYDEIGPAHIFKLNIEGEGFRARQCFRNGIVDLAQYDSIFMQACAEESQRTLCLMAMMRLYYPVGLLEQNKVVYESYLKAHAKKAGELLVKEKNSDLICFFAKEGNFGKEDIEFCIQCAVEMNWTEGVRALMQCWEVFGNNKDKDEYGFDEF